MRSGSAKTTSKPIATDGVERVLFEAIDNEHLVEVLDRLDSSSTSFRDDVYQGLSDRYPG